MEDKEFTREDFNLFYDWWLSKREHAKKIANALCDRTIYDIFLSSDSDKSCIGYTYYQYSDDSYPETGYFDINYLFDPKSIEKATEIRKEEKRQKEILRAQKERDEALNRLECARVEYERLKAQYEPPKQ
jgi:hypothetical protein